MSLKPSVPQVIYEVLDLAHESRGYSTEEFYKNIKSVEFLKKMQCFRRYIKDQLHLNDTHDYIDQTPCLIVKEVVPEDKFLKYEFYGLYDDIRENNIYYSDRFMITYQNTAEKILRHNVLFNANMEPLLPKTEPQNLSIRQFATVEAVKTGIQAMLKPLN